MPPTDSPAEGRPAEVPTSELPGGLERRPTNELSSETIARPDADRAAARLGGRPRKSPCGSGTTGRFFVDLEEGESTIEKPAPYSCSAGGDTGQDLGTDDELLG